MQRRHLSQLLVPVAAMLLGLVLLNFFLYPHGPITWLFDRLFNWWVSVLGI